MRDIESDQELIRQAERAARLIIEADGLVIGAGAGMGVDSGLPDFRGKEGFWKAYPALRGRDFTQMANPTAFLDNPNQAWGFYGHRLNLYRQTVPHLGFHFLLKIASHLESGYQVFTSNVDGQFQLAGFDEKRVYECHGSIHHLQCSRPCSDDIWSSDSLEIKIDDTNCIALSELPQCPQCGAMARPNILMFGDYAWNPGRTDEQGFRMRENINRMNRPVIIECGAGTAVPTVRYFCEQSPGTLIRINPRETHFDFGGGIALRCGAKQGLELIVRQLEILTGKSWQ
ncbi:MAG: hypothetical protein OQJ89_16225 [Kangiellaceae bacterium]|nr:hypothetical protein [Kangiellaceae bacterium]MCW9018521.1 hypothetical protein [Kangiellaceae bacterium]